MVIEKEMVTLIAAIIAALSSIYALIFKKNQEIRTAKRKSLEKYTSDLSKSIHEIIASSKMLLKVKSQESETNWKKRAQDAKDSLQKVRPELTYALWGIDKSIQSFTRLPDYTAYTLSNTKISKKIVKKGSKLGNTINKCIKNCYSHGRSPNWWEIHSIKYYDRKLRKERDNFKKK